MDTDKMPSSINPSERFMDIAAFFAEIEDEMDKLKKEKKKPDFCGFAIFQDKKPAKRGMYITSSLKIIEGSRRDRDIIRLADALAFEMMNDFKVMAIVNMALTKVLYQSVTKGLPDKTNENEKE